MQAAQKQLNPAYQQQVGALQSQIPAIQQLYQALIQGLGQQQQVGNQNILEGASATGFLNSTRPVDQQAMLGQQILAQQGQYSAQQAKEIGDIYGQVAGLGTERANAIANLANSLQQTGLQNKQFSWQRQQDNRMYSLNKGIANKQYSLDKRTANQQYQLQLKAAKKGF